MPVQLVGMMLEVRASPLAKPPYDLLHAAVSIGGGDVELSAVQLQQRVPGLKAGDLEFDGLIDAGGKGGFEGSVALSHRTRS